MPPVGGDQNNGSSRASLSLTYLLRISDDLYQGSNEVNNPNDVSTSFQRVELTGSFKLKDNLVFTGALPWVTATREELGLADSSFYGLGDASFSFLWDPWSENESLAGLAFSFGIILPTGDPVDQPLTGLTAPGVFQGGTGTFQATLGVRYSKNFEEWSAGASFDTSFPLHESDEDFRPATTYRGNLFVSRSLGERFSAKLSAQITHDTKDEFAGTEIENTGSTTVFFKPALVWRPNETFSISASVALPIWRDVNQTQIAVGPLWSVGMSYDF